MNRKIKLNSQEQQQAAEQLRPQPLEFETAEQMLRHDAQQTQVPHAIEHRLQESLAQLPAPPRPWWRRLFGV